MYLVGVGWVGVIKCEDDYGEYEFDLIEDNRLKIQQKTDKEVFEHKKKEEDQEIHLGTVSDLLSRLSERLAPLTLEFDLSPVAASRDIARWKIKGSINPLVRLPFFYPGKIPETSEFKIGPLYLDFTRLVASWLWSDNIYQTQSNPQRDSIASISLGTDWYIELGEDSYFWTTGNLVWLPLEGEFGIDGLGIRDLYYLGFRELLESELMVNGRMAGWDVILFNQFLARDRRFETQIKGKLSLYEGEDFTETDSAGVYEFGNDYSSRMAFEDQYNQVTRKRGVELQNHVACSFERELISETKIVFTPYHRRYWYHYDPDFNPAVDITWEYGIHGMYRFQRTDWKLNPFLLYHQAKNNIDEGWFWSTRAGIEGPLTDQVRIYLDGGVGRAGKMGFDLTYLWRLGIIHVINAFTRHQVVTERKFSSRARGLETRVGYYLDQILGERLRARLFTEAINHESYLVNLDHRVRRGGIRFFYQLASRMGLQQSIFYHHVDWNQGLFTDVMVYETILTYIFSPFSYIELKYTNREQDATLGYREDFQENVVCLSYVYLF